MTIAAEKVLEGSATSPGRFSFSTSLRSPVILLVEGGGGSALGAGRRGSDLTLPGIAGNATCGFATLVSQMTVSTCTTGGCTVNFSYILTSKTSYSNTKLTTMA